MELNNIELFEALQNFIVECNSSNSKLDKQAVIARYPELKEVFNYTFDPFKKYNMTSKQLDKHKDILNVDFIRVCNHPKGFPRAFGYSITTFIEMLDRLHTRNVTGHAAIGMVNSFIECYPTYETLIKLVIDKNLKCRIGEKEINKIFPGTIPTFKCALAQKFDEKIAKKIDWNGRWAASRKLDGVRCLIVIDENSNSKTFSRVGNEFQTLGVIKNEIKRLGLKNIVLDGEVCIIDKNGREDFTSVVSQIKRKDYTIEDPRFKLFDVLTLAEFHTGEGSSDGIFVRLGRVYFDSYIIEQIRFVVIDSEKTFNDCVSHGSEQGWEGIMLRNINAPYKGKRSNDLLKVKKFHDAEYVVKDVHFGPMRVISPITGLEEEIETLTNVTIEHWITRTDIMMKLGLDAPISNIVSVGSGFSLEQRKYYYENPSELIGKEITVQYFEETTNKNGGISLRFPTIKKIWEIDGRNV